MFIKKGAPIGLPKRGWGRQPACFCSCSRPLREVCQQGVHTQDECPLASNAGNMATRRSDRAAHEAGYTKKNGISLVTGFEICLYNITPEPARRDYLIFFI